MNLPADITVPEVKALLEADADFFFIDCRTAEERQLASIEASTLIPMDEITQRVGELESHRNGRIVVYCHLGGRSEMVSQWLRAQGFSQVQNMVGGIDAWSVQIDDSIPRYR